MGAENKPHAVCIPYPAQGHITPMLSLAKLLHSNFGFHITFVNTEHNHRRLLRSQGPAALDGTPSFRFETIPDGLPPSDPDATQHIPSLSSSVNEHGHGFVRELLTRLNEDSRPRVSLIVSDCAMTFGLDVSAEMGIPLLLFWTSSASSFLGYAQYRRLIDEGVIPLKDATYMTNGYMEQAMDLTPSMEGMRLKDLPSFVRTTDKDDTMLNLLACRAERICRAQSTPVIFHTFDALEREFLDDIASVCASPICSIGPLQLQVSQPERDGLLTSGSSLWIEDSECIGWLDSKDRGSVVYVNFGSVTVTDCRNFNEMAWGLANCGQPFLWVIRPDLVVGESSALPHEFIERTRGRGYLASWCDQRSVLSHPSVGGFVTHCGWNSVLESLCSGVPVICWPFFADQTTNCRLCCTRWGVGLEMDADVERGQVGRLVRELMVREKGKEMKRRALEWKRLAEEATMSPNGSSSLNLVKLVDQVIVRMTCKE